jgi:hypothetical protein
MGAIDPKYDQKLALRRSARSKALVLKLSEKNHENFWC